MRYLIVAAGLAVVASPPVSLEGFGGFLALFLVFAAIGNYLTSGESENAEESQGA